MATSVRKINKGLKRDQTEILNRIGINEAMSKVIPAIPIINIHTERVMDIS